MEVIDGELLAKKCDYSFGDQSGRWGNCPNHEMVLCNIINTEFASKVFEVAKKRDYMTVFIDNIRLYKRDIKSVKEDDKDYVNYLMDMGTLFEVLEYYPTMKFIVFTNLEDTPTDEYIFDAIPDNVLAVSAVNAEAYGGKVIPAPYGLQRKMYENDLRTPLLKKFTEEWPDHPPNLLYVSWMQDSNKERQGITELFLDKEWADVAEERKLYHEYIHEGIGLAKFVICPKGNAIDCHRNWEVAYMNRVPVLIDHPYMRDLFEWMDYPALFVKDYSEVTKELLEENDHLWEKAWGNSIRKSKLNLDVMFQSVIDEAMAK